MNNKSRTRFYSSNGGIVWGTIAVVILLLAAAVRIVSAYDNLWFDEIWSYNLARQISAPWDVFTRLHTGNNHHLTTLWMYLCGPEQNRLLYRAPAILAGIGSVALAMQIGRRWGTLEGGFAGLLTGASFLLIVYSSEARGYMLGGFFALATYLLTARALQSRSLRDCLALGAVVALGILSQLSFVEVYLAAIVWSGVVIARRPGTWRQALVDLGRMHALPLAFMLTMYLVDVRYLEIPGRNNYVLVDLASEALAYTLGVATDRPQVAYLPGLLAAALSIVAIALLRKQRADEWIFFAVVMFVAPLVVIAVQKPAVMYARYFFFNVLFFFPLAGYLLGRLYRQGAAGAAVTAGLVLVWLMANVNTTANFMKLGRGNYDDAVRYMAENSDGEHIYVCTDSEMTNILLDFYRGDLPAGRQLHCRDTEFPKPCNPDWALMYGELIEYAPAMAVVDVDGHRYRRARVFPHGGISGFHWALYRNEDK